MKFKYIFLFLALMGSIASCDLISGGDDSTDDTSGGSSSGDQLAKEVAEAKAFYTKAGAQFKFRSFAFNGDLNNRHEMNFKKIFEKNGQISYISETFTSFGGTNWVYKIGATGDLVLEHSISGNFLHPKFENEINSENQLISFNYGNDATSHGGYGNSKGILHNHSLQKYQILYMNQTEQGYMTQLKGKTFVLSMGLNSNTGWPSLYTHVPGTTPAQDKWELKDLDFMRKTGINFTNDVSKAGNSNKVFWTWISYDALNTTNGKLHVLTFDGSNFSTITSKSIGQVGETLSMEKKHMPILYRNPNNLDQPYIVVRRYNNLNIFDVYKYTGSAIEPVVEGVTLPSTLPSTNGTVRDFKEMTFAGSNLYLINGFDNKLYKLKGKDWQEVGAPLMTGENRITAIEGAADGLYVGIAYQLQVGNIVRVAADMVFLKN
jgi:hypothetical protein